MSDSAPADLRLHFAAGRFPYHDLLGLEVLQAEGGRSRLQMQVDDRHLRDSQIVHGGVLASLLDAAVGVAARSVVASGPDLVTIQLNLNFVRATGPGETLVVTGEVQHAGRTTIVARGEIRTAAGKLVATGTGTLYRLPDAPGKL